MSFRSPTVLLAACLALLVLAVPASAYEVRISVLGAGSVDETTPANLAYCSSSQATANWTVGNWCWPGHPDGDYGWNFTVTYVAEPSPGWRFVEWRSDGQDGAAPYQKLNPVICDGATSNSSTYTGQTCTFRTYENLQTRAVFVDETAPSPSLTGGPAEGTTTGRSATFTFSVGDHPAGQPLNLQCRLRRGTTVVQNWTSCTSGKSYSDLDNGGHTFDVNASDPSGNNKTVTRNWNVDAVAPETQLTEGPAADSVRSARTATFQFTGSGDPQRFRCRIDGGVVVDPCNSPYTTPALADGRHTFSVWAVDAYGNEESSPATRTWSIDATAPDTAIASAPATLVASGAAEFTFSSAEATSYECRLDAEPWAACTSPKIYNGLPDGQHSFSVRGRDAAGNVDASEATHTWTVDTAAPETTIEIGPGAGSSTTDTGATFTFSASEAATFRCSLDGAAPAACSSPHALSGLSVGTHTLKVWAVDAAGNTDATPAERTWSVTAGTTDGGGGAGGGTTPPDTSVPQPLPDLTTPRVAATLSWGYRALRRYTILSKLTLANISPGSTVRVTCAGKCPVKRFAKTGGGTMKLTKFLRRRLRVGTVLTVTVTKAGHVARVFTVKIRRSKAPLVRALCLHPGERSPRSC